MSVIDTKYYIIKIYGIVPQPKREAVLLVD